MENRVNALRPHPGLEGSDIIGNQVGAVDGDPLYNAQDTEIKNFAVGKGEVKGDKANLPVTFASFGKKQSINYSLVTVNGAWKINNISYGAGESLMKWLKDTYSAKPDKDAASSGNFEGRHQVGETSCTVNPVKMAYEVRWAKGSGSEKCSFSKTARHSNRRPTTANRIRSYSTMNVMIPARFTVLIEPLLR